MEKAKIVLALMIVFTPVQLCFAGTSAGIEAKKGVWKAYEIEYVSGEILLKAKSNAGAQELTAALLSQGYTMKREFDKLRCATIEAPHGIALFEEITRISGNPLVEWAEPNGICYAGGTYPNDPHFQDQKQWALHNTGQWPPGGVDDADIDAPEAWDFVSLEHSSSATDTP